MGKVMGIDFGTSYSSCSVVQDRHPVLVPISPGSNYLPSVVGYNTSNRFVIGEAAQRQQILNYSNTVYGFKRFMGRKFHSRAVQDLKDYFFYDIVPGPADEVRFRLRERELSCEEIGALLLGEIHRAAQAGNHLSASSNEAIISVPAYFNHAQRQSIRQACADANIYVRKIINEPTAAALAYGYGRDVHETTLIYDLGGGTFDVTVLEIDGNEYRVLATTGDSLLGGLDFDNRIVEWLIERFEERTGQDLFEDLEAIQRLREAAERAKVDLSSSHETTISLPGILRSETGAALDLEERLTVETLNELCIPLVERTMLTVRKALRMAGKKPADIDEVLLVGGQTWMPLIRRKVEAEFNRPPCKRIHPMEAVSMGCAIQAGIFEWGLQGVQEVYLYDVVPLDIAFGPPEGQYQTVFHQNAPVNSRRVVELSTDKDNQTSIVFEIRQGNEPDPRANELLGFYEFDRLAPKPRGRTRIELEFFVDRQCLLTVIGRDPESGREVEAHF